MKEKLSTVKNEVNEHQTEIKKTKLSSEEIKKPEEASASTKQPVKKV